MRTCHATAHRLPERRRSATVQAHAMSSRSDLEVAAATIALSKITKYHPSDKLLAVTALNAARAARLPASSLMAALEAIESQRADA